MKRRQDRIGGQAARNWLLVGSSGRIGRMLSRHWKACPPIEARIVLQAREPAKAALSWSPLDGPLPAQRGSFDAMIVLAGVTPGPGADLSLNIALADACLAAAHEAAIPRVLLASSSAVYGVHGDRPFAEGDNPQPVNDYGRAKLAMEAACTAWRAKGLEICYLRIGNVAGADALLLNARQVSVDNPLRIDRFSDGGGPVRSYIGPATMARVLESLADAPNPLPDILNLAAPRPVSMSALAEAAGLPWTWKSAPVTAFQYITLACDRLEGLHAFDPADSTPAAMVSQWTDLKDPE